MYSLNKRKRLMYTLIFTSIYILGAVQGSTYGKLSADSSNVVQLVKAQYEAITSSIEMKVNNLTDSQQV